MSRITAAVRPALFAALSEPQAAVCGNCGQAITRQALGRERSPWVHGELAAWGQRGCRAATFDGHGWDDSLPRAWLAEPGRRTAARKAAG